MYVMYDVLNIICKEAKGESYSKLGAYIYIYIYQNSNFSLPSVLVDMLGLVVSI